MLKLEVSGIDPEIKQEGWLHDIGFKMGLSKWSIIIVAEFKVGIDRMLV